MVWREVDSVNERKGELLKEEEERKGIGERKEPAGHLEQHESLIDAAARETLEETCWHSDITAYLGVTIVTAQNGICYLRHSFVATALEFDNTLTRDSSIIDTHWMSREALVASKKPLRHGVVLDVIDRYIAGTAVSLDLVRHL